ncbi:MAG TPA: hypothetical protein VFG10_09585 [Saprospiraceae bacterium]|nr:hypothetical protein [Saprospiraceae bacterium]
MNRITFLFLFAVIAIASCKPAVVKEEPQTVAPPPSTIPDSIPVQSLTRLWNTDAKLTTSESVYYDTTANLLYVSCIGGVPPDKKDNDGFIAKVGLDGKIITLKWATGMSAPKGMGRSGNTLYVTDIDRVVAIDVNTGKISNSWKVAGASFLNDIAVSHDGTVYISDSNKSTIHQLSKGKVTPVFSDTTLHGTNGLFADGQRLLIAADGTTYSFDIAGKHVNVIAQGIPAGDGIERYGDGIFQSNWNGEVYYIDASGKLSKVLDTKEIKMNTADIEVIENKNLLFVPTFFGNSVTAYTISMKKMSAEPAK